VLKGWLAEVGHPTSATGTPAPGPAIAPRLNTTEA
jgi:hypothetical protein